MLCASRQKSRAIRARLWTRFPFDGTDVLVGSAVAIQPILRANAVPVLRDFSRDPISLWEGADDVADELRLANTSRVPANYDHSPLGRCVHVTSLPA